MSFLIGYRDPDGYSGYATITAENPLDACRQFRYLVGGASFRITQVIDVAVLEAG